MKWRANHPDPVDPPTYRLSEDDVDLRLIWEQLMIAPAGAIVALVCRTTLLLPVLAEGTARMPVRDEDQGQDISSKSFGTPEVRGCDKALRVLLRDKSSNLQQHRTLQ